MLLCRCVSTSGVKDTHPPCAQSERITLDDAWFLVRTRPTGWTGTRGARASLGQGRAFRH